MPGILVSELDQDLIARRQRDQFGAIVQPTRPLASNRDVVSVACRKGLNVLDDDESFACGELSNCGIGERELDTLRSIVGLNSL